MITLTTVPWRRHCGDWPTACLKHACLWSSSSSRTSNYPVLVPSQHLLVLVQRLNFPTMLLKCALVQFWIVVLAREAGYPLLSKITIDLISPPTSQAYAERLFSVCVDWRQASGTEWQKTLNVAYFSEWTWSTFDNVNPVSGRWVFHFNSWL